MSSGLRWLFIAQDGHAPLLVWVLYLEHNTLSMACSGCRSPTVKCYSPFSKWYTVQWISRSNMNSSSDCWESKQACFCHCRCCLSASVFVVRPARALLLSPQPIPGVSGLSPGLNLIIRLLDRSLEFLREPQQHPTLSCSRAFVEFKCVAEWSIFHALHVYVVVCACLWGRTYVTLALCLDTRQKFG